MNKKILLFWKMFIANLKQFIRDSSALFWTLAFPIILTVIFGIVFSGGGEVNYTIGVSAGGEMGEQLVNGLKEVPIFTVKTGSEEEEIEELKEGRRSLVIVLPEINSSGLSEGEAMDVDAYYNGTDERTGQSLITTVQKVFSEMERQISGTPRIFNLNSRPVQTRELTDFDYILPGILAMALMQLGLFGAFDFMNLRDQGVLRGLAVTPLPRLAVFQSEVILRVMTAIVQTVLIVLLGWALFKVTIIGNILQLSGLVVLGSLTFVSLGYMLASFSSSLEAGRNLIQIVQFPMMFLSGIFFPVDFMPGYIQPVVRAIPLTYLGDALRQTMVGAPPSYGMMTNVGVLLGWLVTSSILALKFWRWE